MSYLVEQKIAHVGTNLLKYLINLLVKGACHAKFLFASAIARGRVHMRVQDLILSARKIK